MKFQIIACIANLFNSFYEEAYRMWLHFFKVMRQQTIGEVANPITGLWAKTKKEVGYMFCPCLSVCLSVSKITQKRVYGFG